MLLHSGYSIVKIIEDTKNIECMTGTTLVSVIQSTSYPIDTILLIDKGDQYNGHGIVGNIKMENDIFTIIRNSKIIAKIIANTKEIYKNGN